VEEAKLQFVEPDVPAGIFTVTGMQPDNVRPVAGVTALSVALTLMGVVKLLLTRRLVKPVDPELKVTLAAERV
jgi:hypothetical protein